MGQGGWGMGHGAGVVLPTTAHLEGEGGHGAGGRAEEEIFCWLHSTASDSKEPTSCRWQSWKRQ